MRYTNRRILYLYTLLYRAANVLRVYREAPVALVEHRRRVAQSQLHDLAVRRLRQSRSSRSLRVRVPAKRAGRDRAER